MSLDTRQEEFDAEPCVATARRYASELFDYFADDMVGNDTLRAGLIEIANKLTEGRSDFGHPVKIAVERA